MHLNYYNFIPTTRSRTTTLLRLHPGYKSHNDIYIIMILNKNFSINKKKKEIKSKVYKSLKRNLLPARDGRCVQDLSIDSP